jgi:hypothetical protein
MHIPIRRHRLPSRTHLAASEFCSSLGSIWRIGSTGVCPLSTLFLENRQSGCAGPLADRATCALLRHLSFLHGTTLPLASLAAICPIVFRWNNMHSEPMICVPRSAPKWLKISATLSFFIFAGFPLPQAAAQPGPAEFRVDRILPAWLSHRASSVNRTGSRLSGSECGTADPSLP